MIITSQVLLVTLRTCCLLTRDSVTERWGKRLWRQLRLKAINSLLFQLLTAMIADAEECVFIKLCNSHFILRTQLTDACTAETRHKRSQRRTLTENFESYQLRQWCFRTKKEKALRQSAQLSSLGSHTGAISDSWKEGIPAAARAALFQRIKEGFKRVCWDVLLRSVLNGLEPLILHLDSLCSQYKRLLLR